MGVFLVVPLRESLVVFELAHMMIKTQMATRNGFLCSLPYAHPLLVETR